MIGVRPQFSLAALFVVMTMLAMLAGIAKWGIDAGLSPWTVAVVFLVIIGGIGVAVAKSLTL